MSLLTRRRRLSAGVELIEDRTADVRVWAPACGTMDVVIDGRAPHPLQKDEDGVFGGVITSVSPGDRYWLRLDGDRLRPDPVSRSQPDGPHGASMIVDPDRFRWRDADWRGLTPHGQVLYEMHVGTFTPEGTWNAAAAELPALADLGITVIEMMPIADFPGRFGWGYDGVCLYAPSRLYGEPDDLRAFVDRAHALGVGVILDVVYNHLGPDGNYLAEFSPDYFTDRYTNDWGRAINFEGPAAARAYFVENAAYWIAEFHFDGLRLDATQDIHDRTPDHVLAEIARRARAAGGERRIYLIAENEPQDTRLVRAQDAGGYGLDALWNDDYHHAAIVAMTGRREAYYTDYDGSPQELISCAKYGYLYQGQWYAWQQNRRGTSGLDLPACSFVSYIENHDQVANSAFGRRTHQLTSPGRHRALTTWTLLGPATPMLFQGQEFSASTPFLYFADHREELREPIRAGRREFLGQFPSLRDPGVAERLAAPDAEETFRRCTLDLRERQTHAPAYAFHRDLLHVRRADPVLSGTAARRVDGAVLGPHACVLRYFGGESGDRLLVINLGPDLVLRAASEPLLAPPFGARWTERFNSESVQYGGQGRAPVNAGAVWHIAGESALLLTPEPEVNDDAE